MHRGERRGRPHSIIQEGVGWIEEIYKKISEEDWDGRSIHEGDKYRVDQAGDVPLDKQLRAPPDPTISGDIEAGWITQQKHLHWLLGNSGKMQEYNYKFMAYPILNSLTHETADKIEALIDYSEVMTRGKYQ